MLHLSVLKTNKGPVCFALERKPEEFLWHLLVTEKEEGKSSSWKIRSETGLKYYQIF